MSRHCFDWSQVPEISQYVQENYTQEGPRALTEDIAKRWGINLLPHQVRKRWRVLTGENALWHRNKSAGEKVEVPAPEVVFRNKNERPGFDRIAEMFDAAMEEVERKEADFLGQTSLKVDFGKVKLPLGICFSGDWQIGTNGVLMRQLRKDTATIAGTPGLYQVLMGDLIQNMNMVKHPSSMHEMTLTDPQDQMDCVRLLVHETLGNKPLDPTDPKILAAVTGNHEHNSKKAAGIDPTRRLCEEFQIPYLWHGGLIDVTVGQSQYEIGVRHLFRAESSVNTTNAQRMMYLSWKPADVEVIAHRHYNDMQKRPMPGRDTIFLRSGTYQQWDDHGQMSGGYRGNWGLPLIVLFPDSKRIVPFYGNDFYIGLEFLEDQRRRYQEKLGCLT